MAAGLTAMEGLREILVALPGTSDDVYRRHQLVWRALHGRIRPGSRFLFAAVSPHLVRVRAEIERGEQAVLGEGDLRVDLVAASRIEQRMRPLTDAELPDWTRALLQSHGYRLDDLALLSRKDARGVKVDRVTGRALDITLPVVSLHLRARIEHRARAALAWGHGIGRGRRFGYGMVLRAG